LDIELQPEEVMRHRIDRAASARTLGRRGITVLSLVLLILAVVVAIVLLTRTLAH
jgi:uncharacterized membrane protein